MVGICDGRVGVGKSSLAQQIAAYIDPYFNIQQITFDAETFSKAVLNAKKKSAIVFDEALSGLNIRRTMSGINIMLTSLLTEIRQKNLFILLCLPSIFDLDKSMAIHRSSFLIHVYNKGFKKGYYMFYGRRTKSKLFASEWARKTYSYNVRPNFYGYFGKGYIVDEEAYRKLKSDVLKRYLPDSKKIVDEISK